LILSGPRWSGKTHQAMRLAAELQGRGVAVGGVVSPRVVVNGVTIGYQVQDLLTEELAPLCSLTPPGIRFRRFFFSPQGIALGNRALARAAERAQVAMVDELGPLELTAGGFAPGLSRVRAAGIPMIITLRPELLEEVQDWLGLPEDVPTLLLA